MKVATKCSITMGAKEEWGGRKVVPVLFYLAEGV